MIHRNMKRTRTVIRKSISIVYFLLCGIVQELRKIKPLIFEAGVSEMPKKFVEAIEAMLRALIYFEILLMGASIGGLSLFIVGGLVIRFGQFFYELVLRNKWI